MSLSGNEMMARVGPAQFHAAHRPKRVCGSNGVTVYSAFISDPTGPVSSKAEWQRNRILGLTRRNPNRRSHRAVLERELDDIVVVQAVLLRSRGTYEKRI